MGKRYEEEIHKIGNLNKQKNPKANNYYNKKMKLQEPYEKI